MVWPAAATHVKDPQKAPWENSSTVNRGRRQPHERMFTQQINLCELSDSLGQYGAMDSAIGLKAEPHTEALRRHGQTRQETPVPR